MSKPILCLDFDGVIHQYNTPWSVDTVIADGVTEGFFEWAEKAAQLFTLVIYSSRSKNPEAVSIMESWIRFQWKKWEKQNTGKSELEQLTFQFASEKPAAFLTIDDRALTFTGDWSAFDPEILRKFKPWNK